MFNKNVPTKEVWNHSKEHMLVRCGFLVNLPENFPKIDDNFNQLTSNQFCMLFDKILKLPSLNSQDEDCERTIAYITAVKQPYIIQIYLANENITFEIFATFAEDKWDDANKEGCGSADANTIKTTISLIENKKDAFEYLRENSIDWDNESDD